MMKFIFALILCLSLAQGSDTLRVATYNILNYSGTSRNSYLETATQGLEADIIVVQEILSQTAVDSFAISVLNNQYSTIPFNDGYDTDNHIFYKSDKVEFLSDSYISTALRDIAEYKLKTTSGNEIFFIYSAHLKASSGSDNEQKRLAECTILRDHLNQHPPGTNFIVLGDFNFYDSYEPGYQKLIGSEADNDGRSFDPLDSPGNWHNSESFADIHTQSPRAEQFGGGAHGGLDDRFDFILISEALSDEVITSSYTEYGNDGQHFNLSINAGANSAVSADVADALYYGSDHLPVFCDFVFDSVSGLGSIGGGLPKGFVLYQNYPNPFNPETTISYHIPYASNVLLEVLNTQGQNVMTMSNRYHPAGVHRIKFNADYIASGTYYYRISFDNFSMIKRMLLLK